MEVKAINHQALDLDFHGAMKPVGDYYFSAPTSPDNLYQLYQQFDDLFRDGISGDRRSGRPSAVVRSDREETPGSNLESSNSDDFVFDVSQEWETASLSAEELFDGGMIKPLIPLQPVSGTGRKIQVTYAAAWTENRTQTERGRETVKNPSKPRAVTRSVSPAKGGGEYPNSNRLGQTKKWKLKDLFLLRSASEGRAAEKDVMKKYTVAAFRRPSMRAMEGWRSRKMGTGVSAHEIHYTVNRAISGNLKKTTFLPYKQGIVGRLAFNPAVHALANGFGVSRK